MKQGINGGRLHQHQCRSVLLAFTTPITPDYSSLAPAFATEVGGFACRLLPVSSQDFVRQLEVQQQERVLSRALPGTAHASATPQSGNEQTQSALAFTFTSCLHVLQLRCWQAPMPVFAPDSAVPAQVRPSEPDRAGGFQRIPNLRQPDSGFIAQIGTRSSCAAIQCGQTSARSNSAGRGPNRRICVFSRQWTRIRSRYHGKRDLG